MENGGVMTAPTDAVILENLRTAYNDLISGRISSYEVDGQKITYQSISILLNHISTFETRIARESSGGTVGYATFSRP